MLTIQTAIIILVVLTLIVGSIAFYLLRKTKYKFTGFFIAGAASFIAYTSFIPHVYVLDDALENRYEEYVAIYPSSFTFKNNNVASVPVSGKAIVINNNDGKRVFRIDYYSTSSNGRAPSSRWLQPYEVTPLDHAVHYVYQDSPATVRIKGNSTSRGVIADRK